MSIEGRNRSVATWLSREELELFRAIAKANHVSPAAYLRAMIVDVLVEEGPKVPLPRRRVAPSIFAIFKSKALKTNGMGETQEA